MGGLPIGQEVAEAGGGLANQGSSSVFCWFLGTIKVLRLSGSGKYLSCILCKSLQTFSVPCLVYLATLNNQTSILSKISAGASLHASYYVITFQKSLLSCLNHQKVYTMGLNQNISKGRVSSIMIWSLSVGPIHAVSGPSLCFQR